MADCVYHRWVQVRECKKPATHVLTIVGYDREEDGTMVAKRRTPVHLCAKHVNAIKRVYTVGPWTSVEDERALPETG